MDNLSQTDVILSKCRFIPHNFRRDAWQNLWSPGSYGSLDSQQNGAAVDVSAERWRHIHAFIGKNMIALRVQRLAAGANITCLRYATDWWAVIGPVIHGESKSQATRSSSDNVGLLHTLSTIDTQKSKLGLRFVLEVLAKLMVRENSSWDLPKVGAHLILDVQLILETRRALVFYQQMSEDW